MTFHFYLYVVAKVNHMAMASPNSKLQGSTVLPKLGQAISTAWMTSTMATSRYLGGRYT